MTSESRAVFALPLIAEPRATRYIRDPISNRAAEHRPFSGPTGQRSQAVIARLSWPALFADRQLDLPFDCRLWIPLVRREIPQRGRAFFISTSARF
jgi:hypothetical protein